MGEDIPTAYLGLTYEPYTGPGDWVGPTYADYAAQYPADPPMWTPQPVKIPAVIAWGVAVVALFVLLNRSV